METRLEKYLQVKSKKINERHTECVSADIFVMCFIIASVYSVILFRESTTIRSIRKKEMTE